MSIPDFKDPTNIDSITMPLLTKDGKRTDDKIGLTPGESIVNKDATELFPELISKMNSIGMQDRLADNAEVMSMFNKGTVSLNPVKSIIPKQRPTFVEDIFQDARTWPTFTQSIADIESFGGKYDVKGGKNNHYDGKYQFGKIAKEDVIQWRKDQLTKEEIKKLQHTDAGRKSFREDPELQEKIMKMYVSVNHDYLKDYPGYKDATHARKMELLGYAHNQGAAGTKTYLSTGVDGKDGNGTKGSKYSREINKNINDAFKIENYDKENTPIPNLAQLDAAEEAVAGVPRTVKLDVPEVATESKDSNLFSRIRDYIGDISLPVIPGYTGKLGFNEGVTNMNGEVSFMDFMKLYKGDLSEYDPSELTPQMMGDILLKQNNAVDPNLKTDEVILNSSSDVGANSFAEAGVQQFNNPRLSVPIPGADYGMTDSAQLRGGNVRPDMMPPGYTPPAETYPNYMPPQSERYKDDVRYNVDQELLSSEVPPKFNLDSTEVPIGNGLVPYSNYTESGSLDPRVDPNFTGKVVDGMVISSDEPNAVKIPLDMYDHERGFEGWDPMLDAIDLEGTGGGGYIQDYNDSKQISMLVNSDNANTALYAGDRQLADYNALLANKERELNDFLKNNEALLAQAQKEIRETGSVSQDTRALLEAANRGNTQINIEKQINDLKNKIQDNKEVATETSMQLRSQWLSDKTRNDAMGLESLTFEEWVQKKYPDTGINSKLKESLISAGVEFVPESNEGNDLEVKNITKDIDIDETKITPESIKKAENEGSRIAVEKPGMFDNAQKYLSNMFGDLFDVDELKRAAILFLGAKLLGFTGNTAAAFAAETYLTREQNFNTHVRKLLTDGDYTAASIQKFKKSKDANDLIKLGAPLTFTGTTEQWYGTDMNGKTFGVTAAKMQRGKNDYYWVNQRTGKEISKVNYNTSAVFDPTSDEGVAYSNKILSQVKDSLSSINEKVGEENNMKRPLAHMKDPVAAGNAVAMFARQNQLSLEQALEVWRIASNNAMAFQARQIQQGDTGSKVTSITPFLSGAYVNINIKSANPFNERVSEEMKSNLFKNTYAKYLNDPSIEENFPDQFNRMAESEVYRHTFIIEAANERWQDLQNSTLPEDIKLVDQVTKNAMGQGTTQVFELMMLDLKE